MGEARLEAGKIAEHSVVVGVLAELGIEPRQQDPQPQVAVLPTPLGEPPQGVVKRLASGSTCDMGLSCPVRVPATLEAQKLQAGLRGWGMPAEGHDPRLVRRELPPTLPSSLAQPRVDAVGLCLSLSGSHASRL